MIIPLIKNYQQAAERAVNVFRRKFQVTDIIKGWHDDVYPREGSIKEEGLTSYMFHGYGLRAYFEDGEEIDFDLLYTLNDSKTGMPVLKGDFEPTEFHPPRYDGVSLYSLINYIGRQPSRYSNYQNKSEITKDFDNLIQNGIIARQENSRFLYFFTETIDPEILDHNTKTSIKHSW